MKVIFIQEVAGVAKRDQVREVANGFALNYLFPAGLAVRATPEKLNALLQHTVAIKQADIKKQSQAQSWFGQLKGKAVTVTARTTPQGTLYAGINQAAVAQAISEQLKVPVQAAQVVLPSHLKTISEHQVAVKLNDSLSVNIKFIIKSSSDAKN